MTPEKQARLQACLRELAGILYEETNLAEVSNLESIEKTVRSHMLKHVSPEIAIFYRTDNRNQNREDSKSKSCVGILKLKQNKPKGWD
jgi:hypothetical protein